MDVKTKVKTFFNENFMVEFDGSLSDNDSLLDNGVIDSTGVLELVTFLEESFNVKVEDDEIVPENLDSLDNIEGFVNKKINKN